MSDTSQGAPKPGAARAPGAFKRAEASSRRVVLYVGLGVVAFVVGSLMMGGVAARVADRVGLPDSELGLWLWRWALLRIWLFVVLPLFGWAAGRFLEAGPWRFGVSAALSGEAFGLLLAVAGDGVEFVFSSPREVLARVLTLLAGISLAAWSTGRGAATAAAAQASAEAEAERRKAEYAEYISRIDGG